MRIYTVQYVFSDEARTHRFELKQARLPVHEAAMHLLQLHFGYAENSLFMPNGEASPDEIIGQAARVGLRDIHVVDGAD
ncbi:hypothetical protein ACIQAL_05835 [Pseudomonas sp. NPDC088368]|jgi:hypothetical protein|uniref:hypothetical protein n=1 Tax=Pseudomonas sp. NPDC088368 TaxID=3364453 RepID=UPI003803264C